MTLDDVYGPEYDRFPLEQERKPVRALEWDDMAAGTQRYAGSHYRLPCADATVHASLPVLLQSTRRIA